MNIFSNSILPTKISNLKTRLNLAKASRKALYLIFILAAQSYNRNIFQLPISAITPANPLFQQNLTECKVNNSETRTLIVFGWIKGQGDWNYFPRSAVQPLPSLGFSDDFFLEEADLSSATKLCSNQWMFVAFRLAIGTTNCEIKQMMRSKSPSSDPCVADQKVDIFIKDQALPLNKVTSVPSISTFGIFNSLNIYYSQEMFGTNPTNRLYELYYALVSFRLPGLVIFKEEIRFPKLESTFLLDLYHMRTSQPA